MGFDPCAGSPHGRPLRPCVDSGRLDPRMPLRGTLDTMTLPDLLQWMGTARKTGMVTLSQGTITKKIFIETGLVTGSVSNDPSEYIGQFLLSYGRITEEQ